jgi:tRNA-Thr(GGU) m(6)t(6)A37 methyltransferase TsaA
MDPVTYQPIGTIRSPHRDLQGMPIQPSGARGVRGHIDLLPELASGLQDLEGFSHLLLIYHFHQARECQLVVHPFLDDRPHGVFATRAPNRPNPIGLSVVRLEGIQGPRLEISNVDVLDGTPLLDIKPYVPAFDAATEVRIGWLQGRSDQAQAHRADDRFS